MSHITEYLTEVSCSVLPLEMPISLHPAYFASLRQLKPWLRVCNFLRKMLSLNFGIYQYSTLHLVPVSSSQFKKTDLGIFG